MNENENLIQESAEESAELTNLEEIARKEEAAVESEIPTEDVCETEPKDEPEIKTEPTPQPAPAVIGAPNPQNTILFTPVTAPKKTEPVKFGVKVFFSIIAFVLAISVSIAAGYIAGRELTPTYKAPPTGVTSKPVNEATLTDSEIYEKVTESVVSIVIYNNEKAGKSSGVIMSEDGYIITNDHIYSSIPNAKFLILTKDGKRYDASYVAGDTKSDIAVLKVDATGFTPAEFGDSNELIVGERALAIGFTAREYEKAILTTGTISSVARRVVRSSAGYSTSMIQTDSAVNPGSSGGALVNEYGQVIGIVTSKNIGEEIDSMGFAIHSNVALRNAKLLIDYGYVKGRAKLGILYTEQSEAMSKVDPSLVVGLKIAEINSDSPFADLGIQVGDIITHVNDIEILNAPVILDVIEASSSGDSIFITVQSGTDAGKSAIYTIKLAEDKGSSSYKIGITDESAETEIK